PGLRSESDANTPRRPGFSPASEGDIAEPDSIPATIPFVEANKMMQPHGDRSKVVIEPMLTDQWFVDTAKIVQPALDAVRDGRVKILPEQHEKVYFHWLENIEPWCISRQLWWGHQIPVWYGPHPEDIEAIERVMRFMLAIPKGGSADFPTEMAEDFKVFRANRKVEICASSEDDALSRAREIYGEFEAIRARSYERVASSKYSSKPGETRLIGGGGLGITEDGRNVIIWRDPDVLDTWFSSGLWPIGTLGWPEQTPELEKYFPTSVLVTGFDIIFFWVARMMMMQLAVVDQIPFHTVYVHALVRDEKGKKMSKSLGNVLDPLDLIDDYGADAVRFTVTSMAAMGRDLKLSKDRIAGYRNFTTKLWNATRFAEMNEVFAQRDALSGRMRDGGGTEAGRIPDAKNTVNRWIIGETARARLAVDEALEGFRFNDAANTLYAFVWGKVCDWYVEFAKPLMDGDDAGETRATMAWVLDQCYILLHPIMPFITEELWALTGDRPKMLVHADWPGYGADLIDGAADREMNWVISLISDIRSARSEMHVPAGLHLPIIQTALDDKGRTALANNLAIIQRLARIDGLTEGKAPKGAITIAVEGGSFAIPLAGVIDVEAEKSRLSKALEKLDKDMNGLRARLKNPKFVASAPDEIVAETREKLTLGDEESAKLNAALKRLADI
ncbi:MAG: class I tRNA ligase family protein, partial [Albidovulum sp.]